MRQVFDQSITDYIGDISQIGGIKRYFLATGKARGVEALDVDNGSGLLFTVLPDRGMDIYRLSYKGLPVSFLSKTGIVAPWYQNGRGDEWLRGFSGGFLTTCGLTQAGDPCVFEGVEYGLHGMYSGIPADNVNVFADWADGVYAMRISGIVRQAKVQFENLVTKRTIETALGRDDITLTDVITNEGDREEPLMLLYHMNFGYPLLNPDCEIVIPARKTTGWDEASENGITLFPAAAEPAPIPYEYTWYHDMKLDHDGMAGFMITDSKAEPRIGVAVRYDGNVLDNFVQWRFLHKRDYVMALEPCNNHVRGLAYESRNGTLKTIQPGESVRVRLTARFLEGPQETEAEKERLQSPRQG